MRKKKSRITEEHMAMYNLIPLGKEHAITKDVLQLWTGLSERLVRQYCEDLTCNELVVCNLQNGKGYFRPLNEDDYIAALKLTESRANSLKRKAYGIKSALKRFYIDGNILVDKDEKRFDEKN